MCWLCQVQSNPSILVRINKINQTSKESCQKMSSYLKYLNYNYLKQHFNLLFFLLNIFSIVIINLAQCPTLNSKSSSRIMKSKRKIMRKWKLKMKDQIFHRIFNQMRKMCLSSKLITNKKSKSRLFQKLQIQYLPIVYL